MRYALFLSDFKPIFDPFFNLIQLLIFKSLIFPVYLSNQFHVNY